MVCPLALFYTTTKCEGTKISENFATLKLEKRPDYFVLFLSAYKNIIARKGNVSLTISSQIYMIIHYIIFT